MHLSRSDWTELLARDCHCVSFMTGSTSPRSKRASSYDGRPRGPDGKFIAVAKNREDAVAKLKSSWVNLRSNDGSPASFPGGKSSAGNSARDAVRTRSRPSSRAASVASARSVKSIPEDAVADQSISPAPPTNVQNKDVVRSVSPIRTAKQEKLDISISDTPDREVNGSLMDEMQRELDDDVKSYHSQSSAFARDAAEKILRAMNNDPQMQVLKSDVDVTNDVSNVPFMPFADSLSHADLVARSATAEPEMSPGSNPVREGSVSDTIFRDLQQY